MQTKGKMDHVLIKGDWALLEDVVAGSLFLHGDTIAVKAKYSAIESYIVGSGEIFWVGKLSPVDMRKVLVLPLKVVEVKG